MNKFCKKVRMWGVVVGGLVIAGVCAGEIRNPSLRITKGPIPGTVVKHQGKIVPLSGFNKESSQARIYPTKKQSKETISIKGKSVSEVVKVKREEQLDFSGKSIILGPESFESSVPPPGWSQFQYSSSPNLWYQLADPGYQGSYVAWIDYDPVNTQDVVLETPEMNFSSFVGCTLTFYFWQNMFYDDHFYIGVSTDGGGLYGTWLWYGPWDQTGANWWGYLFDLSAYDGEPSVKVGFNYYTEIPDQDSEGIDYVTITGTEALPNLVPYTPAGWSGPIVCSVDPDTIAEDTLIAGEPYYISWAVANLGNADINDTFYVYVYVLDNDTLYDNIFFFF